MTTKSNEQLQDDAADAADAAIETGIRSAIGAGDIELRPMESVRQGQANVERILAAEGIRRRLRTAHRQIRFRPVAAAAYIADLAQTAGVNLPEAANALGLTGTSDLATLDQPCMASLQAAVCLGINDRNWNAHLKLAEIQRREFTPSVAALRQSASGKPTSPDEALDWAESQLAEAMATGGAEVRNGLMRCEAEIQRVRAGLSH